MCSASSPVDLCDDRTRGSQEICDTSAVSTIIPVLYALKCGMSLVEVWFHLCILLIFICTYKPSSFIILHIPSLSLQNVMLSSVTGLYSFGLNMTTVQGKTVVQVSGKSAESNENEFNQSQVVARL